MATLHATVIGRVQGVGFRHFVRRTAGALGLSGRVVNLPNGAVQVEAEGPRGDLVALLAALEQGPVGSRVERVVHSIEDHDQGRRGFEIG